MCALATLLNPQVYADGNPLPDPNLTLIATGYNFDHEVGQATSPMVCRELSQ